MIETPEQRDARGRSLSAQMGITFTGDDLDDLIYLRGIESRLTDDQRAVFRAIFESDECRGLAGVRPAADLALARMIHDATEAIAGKDAKKRWRAG
jgi:hypothetical protein